MAFNKLPPPRCGLCAFIDRESYRAQKMTVCYKGATKLEGAAKPAAMRVKENQKGCGRFVRQ